MRARWGRVLLPALLLVTLTPVVEARDDGAGEDDFAWPLELWQRLVEAGEGEPDRDGRPMAEIVRRGLRSSGAVALTFDDGYNRRACSRIADTLRKHDAVGTFFINGNLLKAKPARWRHILEGMPVGNHTRSHRWLTRERHPVVIKQIWQNEALHERVLGRPMLKVLRPSYGAYGERVQRIAAQLGYEHLVLWNVDTNDWTRKSTARTIARRARGAPPGSIILMHCARGQTVKALPSIIRHYRRRGIELAGLDEVLGLDSTQR